MQIKACALIILLQLRLILLYRIEIKAYSAVAICKKPLTQPGGWSLHMLQLGLSKCLIGTINAGKAFFHMALQGTVTLSSLTLSLSFSVGYLYKGKELGHFLLQLSSRASGSWSRARPQWSNSAGLSLCIVLAVAAMVIQTTKQTLTYGAPYVRAQVC